MKRKFLWLLPPLLALAFFLLFFKDAPSKHIFLITLDTTRADAVDYATTGNTRTPNLAALAAAGLRCDNAYTVIPITTPSHSAMFYSLPPHVFKVYNNGQERNIPYPALAELMKREGYATGAVVSLAVLKRDFGLAKGFDHYLENFRPGLWYRSAAEVNRDAFALIDKLRAGKSFIWIHYSDPHEPYSPPGPVERFTVSMGGKTIFSGPSIEQPVLRLPLTLQPGANFVRLETELPPALRRAGAFSGISYSNFSVQALDAGSTLQVDYSPDLGLHHERYGMVTINTLAQRSSLAITCTSAGPCRAELAFKYQLKASDEAKRDGYEQEVRYLDAQLGRLLAHVKKRGIYEKSTFLIMGDHGEGLGEYNSHFGHIHYLNKVYTHVPFILCGKNVSRRGVRAGLVSNFSVAPTLLALAHAAKPGHMAGSDLQAGKGDNKLFLETYSPEAYFDAFSVLDFPWQVIFNPGRQKDSLEFYNLEKDRFGTSSLPAGADPSGRRSEMTNSVLRISRIITANKRKRDSLNQKTMDTLKSLGYL
jgi:hypothetical protein